MILMLISSGIMVLANVHADEIQIGDLILHDPWIKATTGNKPVTGGYVMIDNQGNSDDRLIGVATDFAGKSEIHEMKMVNDVMKMRPLADGLVLPAGEHTMLKPGGYHLMFMKLKEPITVDQSYDVTLIFEKAGTVEISLMAKNPNGMQSHSHE